MKKLVVLIPLVASLSACTFFNVNQLEKDTYQIKGHASALKSRTAIMENMKKKAVKVCKGNEFEIVEPGTGKVNKNYSGNRANTSQTVIMTIKCKS